MEEVREAQGEKKRGRRKIRRGVVVSDKMHKTVVVQIERIKMHSKYKKFIRVQKKVKAHDEDNTCREGDLVQIQETRPLSREKRWQVTKIIKRAD